MERILQALLIAVLSSSVWADEYYEFYRLRCAKGIPSLEIERSGYWNVGGLVWPTWDWQADISLDTPVTWRRLGHPALLASATASEGRSLGV